MKGQRITCLRCRHAQMLPATDVRDPMTALFCGLKNELTPLILSGCGLPNEEFHNGRSTPEGDIRREISPLELQYLRANYADGDIETMARHTGRTVLALHENARRFGLRRSGEAVAQSYVARGEAISASKRKSGRAFNQAQRDFLFRCKARGYWPSSAARGLSHTRSRRIRENILRRINKLGDGKVWEWKSIPIFIRRDRKRKAEKEKRTS